MPLLLGVLMPQVSWCAIVVALGVLALLGGVLLAYIGSRLEII